MKNKLLEKPQLAGLSLGLAIIIWLVIMNVNDPIQRQTITNVPVSVVNASYVESMGLSYKIPENQTTVSVMVRGNRSRVERLAASAITVTADLTRIIDLNSDPVMVPVTVSVPGISAENVTVVPNNIRIELEDVVSQDFVVTPTDGGTKPANGYQVGVLTPTPETITIKGPGSLINIIDRVSASVDVSNMVADANLVPTIRIYDHNGEALSDAEMSYLTLSTPAESIRVQVVLYRMVSGVSLKVTPYGTPAAGYQFGEVTITPASVTVVGPESYLQELAASGKAISINGSDGVIDATEREDDFDTILDLRSYLPEGISLAEDVASTAVVSVKILPYNSRSLKIPTKNIVVNGLTAGQTCVFDLSQIEIRVRGSDELLEALTADSVRVTADIQGINSGTVTLPLTVTLPEGLELVENVSAKAVISQTTLTTEQENPAAAAGAGAANTP